jgi:hypothetical protein
MIHRWLRASLVLAMLFGMHPASRCTAKPPDLPANQRIIVYPDLSPLPADNPPVIWPAGEGILVDLDGGEVPAPVRHASWVLTPPLFYTVHPFLWFWSGEPSGTEAQPAAPGAPGEPQSECPWIRQQQAQKQPPVVRESLPSVLDNLAKLEQAEQTLEKARRLLREGRLCEGLKCLEAVRTLCPGSGFEERVNEVVAELFASFFGAPESVEGKPLPDAYYPSAPPQYFPPSPPFPLPRELAAQEDLPQACRDVWESMEACLRDSLRWCQDVLRGQVFSPPDLSAEDPALPTEDEQLQAYHSERATLLGCRLSVHYTNVPLGVVLDDLCRCQVVPVRVDLAALQAAGISLAHPVTLHADNIPFHLALDLLLRQAGLTCHQQQGPLVITCSARKSRGEEESEPTPEVKRSVCPKAEELHARTRAAIQVQARGLLKACYLALAEGRHQKAADLARQAHALAPELVEADPIVYKLHLLRGSATAPALSEHESEECEPRSCPASVRGPANEPTPAAKDHTCQGGVLQPGLPPMHHGVVDALDALLREWETTGSLATDSTPRSASSHTPCPAAGLREQVEEWVDAFQNGHDGTMMFGLGLGGLNVSLQSKAHGKVYTAQLSGKSFWLWSSAEKKTDTEESAEDPDSDK